MYASISRAFRRDRQVDKTRSSVVNGEEPRDLTGQVKLDKKKHEFSGSYSYVYRGMYKHKVVRVYHSSTETQLTLSDKVAVKILQLIGKPESMKRVSFCISRLQGKPINS